MDKSTRSQPMDLLAVILIARLQPGPRLLFQYPTDFQKTAQPNVSDGGPKSTTVSDAYSDGHDTGDRDLLRVPVSDVRQDETATTNPLLHHSEETVQKLLSPGCWCDRKKFEISLDGCTFVGHPIWAAHDNSWSRKHTHDDQHSKKTTSPRQPLRPAPVDVLPAEDTGIAITDASPAISFSHAPESLESHTAGKSLAASVASGSSMAVINASERVSMFNVVFVLAPSQARSCRPGYSVSDFYRHVVRPFSRALHYTQQRSQYVGIACKQMLDMRTKARQDRLSAAALEDRMIQNVQLAWALREIYAKISAGGIAGVRLDGMEMALVVPSSLDDAGGSISVASHNALLLHEDKASLLAELEHPDAASLNYFVREHTPNKSLKKQAIKLGMSIDEVLGLARHLIKWRKAGVIMPLHPRNIYVVPRDAPLEMLSTKYNADYAKTFPVLPSLIQMMKALSGRPVRFGILIPSRDHRASYMDILAYLVRHRFLEQLRTYGWLQAPTTKVGRSLDALHVMNENRRPLSVTSLLSPQMRPVHDDDDISVSSERTAIPVSLLESSKLRSNVTPVVGESAAAKEESADAQPNIIANPHQLSAIDQQRLQHIKDTLVDSELRQQLPTLLRYLDGTHAIEEIAAHEAIKRGKIDSWMDTLQRHGFLVTFRAV